MRKERKSIRIKTGLFLSAKEIPMTKKNVLAEVKTKIVRGTPDNCKMSCAATSNVIYRKNRDGNYNGFKIGLFNSYVVF